MQESYPIARPERTRPAPDEEFLPSPRDGKRKKQSDPKVDLMLIQLILCAVALLGVFACKLIGGGFYDAVRLKYISMVCDRTAIHQVVDAMSNKLFGEGEPGAVESEMPESETASVVAEGGGDENNEPFVDNYAMVAHDLEDNIGNVNAMTLPIAGPINSPFAYRVHPITGKYTMHGGVDIGASAGSEIKAAMAGTVRRSTSDSTSGNYIILDHNESLATMYAHCQELLVKEGERVEKGQVIALVGSTGMSTGPHLHFEVRLNGVKLNPEWILDFTKAS